MIEACVGASKVCRVKELSLPEMTSQHYGVIIMLILISIAQRLFPPEALQLMISQIT